MIYDRSVVVQDVQRGRRPLVQTSILAALAVAGGVTIASVQLAVAATPAAAVMAAGADRVVQLAQLVCDANGCGPGSGRAGPPSANMGRPYMGRDADERRALQERDRQRRERAEGNARRQGEPGR